MCVMDNMNFFCDRILDFRSTKTETTELYFNRKRIQKYDLYERIPNKKIDGDFDSS